jgi:hypothetical protein
MLLPDLLASAIGIFISYTCETSFRLRAADSSAKSANSEIAAERPYGFIQSSNPLWGAVTPV